MQTIYCTIQGLKLYNVPKKKIERTLNQAKEAFPDLHPREYDDYTGSKNAAFAIRRNRIISWIEYDGEETDKITAIHTTPTAEKEITFDLIEIALSELKNEKPEIQIPIDQIEAYQPLIEKHGWERSSYTIYPDNRKSYGFNEQRENTHQIGVQKKKQ